MLDDGLDVIETTDEEIGDAKFLLTVSGKNLMVMVRTPKNLATFTAT
jgi:hypothetical protein